jgi:hypothetical protein
LLAFRRLNTSPLKFPSLSVDQHEVYLLVSILGHCRPLVVLLILKPFFLLSEGFKIGENRIEEREGIYKQLLFLKIRFIATIRITKLTVHKSSHLSICSGLYQSLVPNRSLGIPHGLQRSSYSSRSSKCTLHSLSNSHGGRPLHRTLEGRVRLILTISSYARQRLTLLKVKHHTILRSRLVNVDSSTKVKAIKNHKSDITKVINMSISVWG